MSERRRRYDDSEDHRGKKRRINEGGDSGEQAETLTDIITNVDETDAAATETSLETLANRLEAQLSTSDAEIINVLANCFLYMPERLTVFSSLSGILNLKNSQFGENLVTRLCTDLTAHLGADEFDLVVRLVTALADLGNANVVSLDAIIELLTGFLAHSKEQNLLSDFYVYCVMHALPWIGAALNASQPTALAQMWSAIDGYLNARNKRHIGLLRVWEASDSQAHAQEDHLDCTWAQLGHLRDAGWLERHISRHYANFKAELANASAHTLPEIALPKFDKEAFKYPLPRVVFRLFADTDCPEDEPPMPDSHAIERFLVEEDINWILSNNALNVRECCKALIEYRKRGLVPINYVIVESIFAQLFRLPRPPHLELFYGALLIELCRVQTDTMPQVLAQAAECVYQRSGTLHPMCVDRFVNWFSYHLSNFQYRWSWPDWLNCLEFPQYDRRLILVREVLEKCMRLAYHEKLQQLLPEAYAPLMPQKPQVIFVLDDPDHPAYVKAQSFRSMIQQRKDASDFLLELRADRLAKDEEATFDPDNVAVFTAVLVNMSSKTYSHTFTAFTKYVEVLRRVCAGDRSVQTAVLRTIFNCWVNHKQMLILLVDKLIKMRIIEPISIAMWSFGEDMADEYHRAWIWETLNTAIYRLDCQTTSMQRELAELKLQSARQNRFIASNGSGGDDADNAQDEKPDVKLDVNAEYAERAKEVAALEEDVREMLLVVCHKFTVSLTEQIADINERMDEGKLDAHLKLSYMLGRFKHVFLANAETMWRYSDVLSAELFSHTDIDAKIADIYRNFCSLKSS